MSTPKFDPTAPRLRLFPGARQWDTSNPWLYLGTISGVKRAKLRRGCLIAPLDADPMAFSWPVSGLEVTVIGDATKRAESERLTQALIRDGAKLVACVLSPGPEVIYRYSNDVVENA